MTGTLLSMRLSTYSLPGLPGLFSTCSADGFLLPFLRGVSTPPFLLTASIIFPMGRAHGPVLGEVPGEG